MARLVEVAEAKLFVEERGEPTVFPLVVFHGGPGLDHTIGDYLDLLTEGGGYRLVLADERACGRSDRTVPRETWTLGRMAQDVSDLAASLGVAGGYATLGHSYGVIVVMQNAVDHQGGPRGTIVSVGIAAARWLLAAAPPGAAGPAAGAALVVGCTGGGEGGAAALTCGAASKVGWDGPQITLDWWQLAVAGECRYRR